MSEKTHSKRPSKKATKSSTSSSSRRAVAVAEVEQAPVAVVPDVSELVEEIPRESVVDARDVGEITLAAVGEPTTTRSARVSISKESHLEHFDQVLSLLRAETDATALDKSRVVASKIWRNLERELKRLRADSARLVKGKKRVSTNSTNGGFMKPVRISKAMAKFAGWDPKELRSRVDVTKAVCDYVKTHNLQNPADKRQILVDTKLSKLLDYNPDKEEKPLTYFYLQRKLQPHFEKAVVVA